MTEGLGKVFGMCGVVLLALSIAPTGGFIDPQDSWFVTQWKWIKRHMRQEAYATPVTINPLMLYLGMLLSLVAIALS